MLTTTILTSILLSNLWTPSVAVWDIEEVLAQLAFCESSGNPKAYVKDDGGSPSIGLYQFKQATWDWAVKRYSIGYFWGGVKIIVDEKLIKIKHDIEIPDIRNPEHQKIIATKMLEEGRFDHWKVCSSKLKLAERYETK